MQGLVDSYFQICYSLKEDNGPYFFLELIPSFLSDARTVMRDMAEALYVFVMLICTFCVLTYIVDLCYSLSLILVSHQLWTLMF